MDSTQNGSADDQISNRNARRCMLWWQSSYEIASSRLTAYRAVLRAGWSMSIQGDKNIYFNEKTGAKEGEW